MMKKRINQLRALSFEEWRLLLASIVALPIIAASLKLFGFNKTRSMMSNFIDYSQNNTALEAEQLTHAQSVARMVTIAANHGPYRANCLRRSLLIWWLLARKGIDADLKIGVKNGEEFQAHAWVEFMGISLSEPPGINTEFSPFQNNSEFIPESFPKKFT